MSEAKKTTLLSVAISNILDTEAREYANTGRPGTAAYAKAAAAATLVTSDDEAIVAVFKYLCLNPNIAAQTLNEVRKLFRKDYP